MLNSFYILFSLYSYTVFYKSMFSGLGNKSWNLSFNKNYNNYPILLLVYIGMLANTTYFERSFILDPSMLYFFTLITLFVSACLPQFGQSLVVNLLLTNLLFFSLFLLKSNSLIEFLLFLELSTYMLLAIIFLYKGLYFKSQRVSHVFTIFFYNFIGTYSLYLFIIYVMYVSGDVLLGFTSLPKYISALLFVKVGFGPWFLWNYALYVSLPTNLLVLYIITSVFYTLPAFLLLLSVAGFSKPLLTLLLLISFVMFSSKLFSRSSLRLFFLISSFCSILLLLFAFVLL